MAHINTYLCHPALSVTDVLPMLPSQHLVHQCQSSSCMLLTHYHNLQAELKSKDMLEFPFQLKHMPVHILQFYLFQLLSDKKHQHTCPDPAIIYVESSPRSTPVTLRSSRPIALAEVITLVAGISQDAYTPSISGYCANNPSATVPTTSILVNPLSATISISG